MRYSEVGDVAAMKVKKPPLGQEIRRTFKDFPGFGRLTLRIKIPNTTGNPNFELAGPCLANSTTANDGQKLESIQTD